MKQVDRIMTYEDYKASKKAKLVAPFTNEQIETWGYFISSAILVGFVLWGMIVSRGL